MKFYLEEFTASTSLYISIPAIIKHLTIYLNIGDVIIDDKGNDTADALAKEYCRQAATKAFFVSAFPSFANSTSNPAVV